MKLLDVNVLLAAHRTDHPQFGTAKPWFDELIRTAEPFGAPRSVWASFVRLSTHRRVFSTPTSVSAAFGFATAVIAQPRYVGIEPGAGHERIFQRVCADADCSGDLVADAFLAAIAIEHGCDLVSFDRDFARFQELRWERPEPPGLGSPPESG